MRNQAATEPAARGRIIRKGGTAPCARPVVVATPRTLRPTSAGSSGPGGHSPRRVGRLRDTLLTFIGIPFVFAASAGFMWTRPLEAPPQSGLGGKGEIHARFHHIGNEMAGRFSSKVDGVVVKPEKKAMAAALEDVEPARVARKLLQRPMTLSEAPTKHVTADRDALQRQVYRILKKHGKPVQNGKELASDIVREALAQNYDPVFVAAVIKSESAFNSLARSNKGAQGLMQIMPKTGAWLADQQAIPRRKLTDPGHNLKLGISYLKQLEAEYGGNRVLTLIAYNWGPGHVASASAGGRRVPGEVMQYAVKILNDYRRWSSELRSSVG